MRYRKRLLGGKLGALALAMTLVLAACSGSGDADADADASEDAGTDSAPTAGTDGDAAEGSGEGLAPAVDDDTLVIGTHAEISTPNLARYVNLDDISLVQSFWDTLVRRGRDGFPEPALATEWESSEDGLTWTVKLRHDVVFHNGDPMTAEDVAFSVELFASEDFGAPITQYWAMVEDAVVVDDTTVEFHLSEVNSLFMHQATRAPIIPKDYYEEVGDEEFSRNPVTTGPYKFVEWVPDDRLVGEAFDDYWGGRPAITNLIIRPIPDEASRTAGLRAGDIDIATKVSIDQVELLKENPGIDVRPVAGITRHFVFLDVTRPPFDDVRVRRAVNYAINVPEIITELYQGYAEQIPAMTVPLEPGHKPGLEPYPYDPDRARQLLEEAGYADGLTVGFTVRTGLLKGEEAAQAIAGYLAEVGIQTDTTLVDPATYSQLHKENTITEMGYGRWGGGGQFWGGHHYNVAIRCEGGSSVWSGYWCNESMDALIDEAIEVWATDQDRAIEAIQQAEQIYYDEAGSGFLWVVTALYGAKSGLDWEPHPDDGFYAQEASWGN